MRRLAERADFLLEANEMGAVRARGGRAFVAGPHLNVYNGATLGWLAELGATRWVMPVELSRTALAGLQRERPAGVETEVFAWGRLPLAFSARCFTARHYDLPKDNCEFRCLEHADGLALATREGKPFLTLNGIQTQSAQTYDLSGAIGELASLGVDVVRLSPQSARMDEVIAAFRAVLDGRLTPAEAARALAGFASGRCNGYWHGAAGLDYREAA
jgi:collagenase-like PrtC family protease